MSISDSWSTPASAGERARCEHQAGQVGQPECINFTPSTVSSATGGKEGRRARRSTSAAPARLRQPRSRQRLPPVPLGGGASDGRAHNYALPGPQGGPREVRLPPALRPDGPGDAGSITGSSRGVRRRNSVLRHPPRRPRPGPRPRQRRASRRRWGPVGAGRTGSYPCGGNGGNGPIRGNLFPSHASN